MEPSHIIMKLQNLRFWGGWLSPNLWAMKPHMRTDQRRKSIQGIQRAGKPSGGWLGSTADEGRGKRRYAPGRRTQP